MGGSSRIHEPSDRLGGLPDLGVGFGAPSCGGIDDTMTEMVFEQFHSYCMQRFFHRRYLGKDVNAAPFFFNHSLQPSRLTLNTLEAFEVQVLCADVSVGRIVTTAWTTRISCAHEIPLVSSPVVGQTRNHVVSMVGDNRLDLPWLRCSAAVAHTKAR